MTNKLISSSMLNFLMIIILSTGLNCFNSNKNVSETNLSKDNPVQIRKSYSVPDSISRKIRTGEYVEGPRDYYEIAVDSKMNVALSTVGEVDILILDSTGRRLSTYSFDTIPRFSLTDIGFDESDSIVVLYSDGVKNSFILKGKEGHFKRYSNDAPETFAFLQHYSPNYGYFNMPIPAFYADSLITDRPEKFNKVYNFYFSPEDSSIYYVWVKSFAHAKNGNIDAVYYASNAFYTPTNLLYVNRSRTMAYYSNHGDLWMGLLNTTVKDSKRMVSYGTDYGIYEFAFCPSTKTIVGVQAENGHVKIDFVNIAE